MIKLYRKGCRNSVSASIVLVLLCVSTYATSAGDQPDKSTTCFASGQENACYKPVHKRGRTFSSTYFSFMYKPFQELMQPSPAKPDGPDWFEKIFGRKGTNKERFDYIWKENPNYIFANLTHTAYLIEWSENQNREISSKFESDDVSVGISDVDKELGALVGEFGGQIERIEFANTQAILTWWPDKIILTFRGTEAFDLQESIKDVLDDTDITTTKDYNGACIHSGFSNATTNFWNCGEEPRDPKDKSTKKQCKKGKLKARIEALKRELSVQKEVYVTGHSLGAALAVVSTFEYPNFKRVVTFGEPRIGTNLDEKWN